MGKKGEYPRQRYLVYKNKLTAILRKAEKKYYIDKLNGFKGKMRETWLVINNLLGRGKKRSPLCDFVIKNDVKITKDNEIANEFNEFYVNVGANLAKDIECANILKDYDDYLKDIDIGKSMYVTPTNEQEILNIVNKFNGKSSEDINGVSMNIIKKVVESIVSPLNYICNISLNSGVFPDKLKIAKVIPLYKSGQMHEVSNFRPVSILPQLSKVLEKLFEIRLRNYIDKNSLLFNGQYGFRTNHSTNLALNEMVKVIVNAMDNDMCSIGVFIDLKKAFDTVNHNLLIKKFKYYGIRGVASNFLETYLKDRSQYVQFKGEKSYRKNILCGVPQGSILGPLLFILYINDMHKVSDLLHFIIFADDTNIFHQDKYPARLVNTLNIELEKLSEWFKINKLSLNVTKSNYMVFCNRKSDLPAVKLNDTELVQVTLTKFLGVQIDNKFTWVDQINAVKSKVSRAIGSMYRIRDKVDESTLLTVYNTLILPHLSYCCEIWGNTYNSRVKDLVLLQKRAVRIIDKTDYKEHTSPIFKKYSILKLADLIDFHSCILMFKASNNMLPANVQEQFSRNEEIHKYNTRNKDKFHVKSVSSNLKYMSVNVAGVKLWNSLDREIRNSVSLNIFKKRLKLKLLQSY